MICILRKKIISHQRGITLIEILVTIVILGFSISLISGALGSISQMIRVSSEENHGFLNRFNDARALHDIFANMLINPDLDKSLIGDEENIIFTSSAVPQNERGKPLLINIKILEHKNKHKIFTVEFFKLDEDDKEGNVLMNFQERVIFRYVDSLNNEHKNWPPNGVSKKADLPSAVLILSSSGENLVYKKIVYEGPLNKKSKEFKDFFSSNSVQ